jgi:hypothetical protein
LRKCINLRAKQTESTKPSKLLQLANTIVYIKKIYTIDYLI